ncbi:ABC transporter ATP-binding protein [Rhodococcus sp. CX]|uniref:ABC transporter ATP-binding protein n=1 Tax=Rhodococcus sp. CX TaxID=2789880 RepID=UPI0018CE5C7B|nr:ABC transporter ATP-binding protein [Rhodococcus sp. CX]MBH0122281.1 ABC transporter ATP-binding protein [Rhodococcus sp. CX]
MSTPAVVVDDVSKKFRIYHERNQSLKSAVMRRRLSVHEDFWALKNVSLEVPASSTFALVGDNGSGKSTLLKCLAKILYPNSGKITTHGRMAALLEVGSGFHPELSGRENIYLNASILGMTRKEVERKFDEIVAFSGVEEFIDQPVKNYSSGMYVRLGFSVAINVDPEVLLVDEVLAVGDAAFQEKCAEKFAQFRREGRTVVVVSHSLGQLRNMSDHAVWLEHGQLKEVGPADVVIEKYLDSTRAGIRATEDGKVRWGSGEAVVDTVEVLDRNREQFDRVVPAGSQVVIRVRFTANERISNPVFAISLESADGTQLWTGNTREERLIVGSVEGSGAAELILDSLPLAPGEYTLTSTVYDETMQHVFDEVRGVARLNVGRGILTTSAGYLGMNTAWALTNENTQRIAQ